MVLMRCVDKDSQEIDLNVWEILTEMPYKENVNILYLRNRWRKQDEEQFFLIGYKKIKD